MSEPQQPCEHVYNRSINQPYPRHCIKCNEIEGQPNEQQRKPEQQPFHEQLRGYKTSQGYEDDPHHEGCQCGRCVPVQRSEREWTVERSKEGVSNPMARIMQGDKVVIGWTMRPFSELFQKIADAHKAALAAERQRRTILWEHGNAEQRVAVLEQQLLSTLAAIEKARSTVYAERRDEILDSVDLSALDKHDAAVRKLVVEMLEQTLSDVETGNDPISTASKIRTRLAKVKEGK